MVPTDGFGILGGVIRTVDYAPLTEPVNPVDVKTFRVEAAQRPNYGNASAIGQVIALVVVFVVLGFVGLTFLAVLGPVFVSVFQDAGVAGAVVVAFAALSGFAVFVVIAIVAIRGTLGVAGRWERWYRLDRFARANGMVFSPSDPDPQYPGAIFGLGRSRTALDHLRSASDRFLDYGNYRYVTGSGKNQSTHHWGFLALQLDRSLPHMVLDSRANNGLFGGSNLPATFTKEQVLSLEGDFNDSFTLYCPKQYERDALYVFTPDLMALLIDNAAPFDVEIVDRWMFVYSAARFDLRQPAVHQRLLRIVDTIGAKTLSQTDRYSDERIGDFTANLVAPQGQRLKRGLSVGAVIAIVAVLAFMAVQALIIMGL